MRSLRSLVFIAAFVLAPAAAQASWLDWLNRLDPGPFVGFGPDLNIICVDDQNEVQFLKNPFTAGQVKARGRAIRQMLIVSPEIFFSVPGRRFEDPFDTDERQVRVFRTGAVYEFRLNDYIGLGAGAGFWSLSGGGVDKRLRLEVIPISINAGYKANRGIVQLHWIPKGFKATDFDPASTST